MRHSTIDQWYGRMHVIHKIHQKSANVKFSDEFESQHIDLVEHRCDSDADWIQLDIEWTLYVKLFRDVIQNFWWVSNFRHRSAKTTETIEIVLFWLFSIFFRSCYVV